MIRLSKVFSDRMMFQRETDKNLVWGYGEGEVSVTLIKREEDAFESVFEGKTSCGDDGYFEVELPAYPAGGNYSLNISDKDGSVEIGDITFGDIFVCGGQSNMELPLNRTFERYEEEIKAFSDDNIRFFRVIEKFNFHHTEELIEEGSWYYAKMPEIADFGAVPFFIAKHIRENENVPVGIYNTAIGGTPVKSWCSEKTMRSLGLHVEEFEKCRDDEWVKSVMKNDVEADMAWREEADRSFSEDMSNKPSGKFSVPGFFEGNPDLGGKDLAVYFKKEFELPAGWSDDEIKLYLGAIIDSDKVYVNGQYVGETGYLYPPRIYRVPKGILKEGKNTIEIRLLVFRCEGGFMPGKDYMLKRPDGEVVALDGEWEYTVSKEMPFLENYTFFSYKATGVYNCMIYPLRKQRCRAFFFYQGESNVDDYATYKDECEAMILDWRELWGEEIPFMFVQIAGFNDGNRNGYFGRRSFFTEEQRKCCELPKVAMIQAYDLGEFNDLHPTNKKEVGRRAFLAAEDLVYGRTAYIPGPEKKEVELRDGEAEITFDEGVKLILSHGFGVITDEDRDEKNVVGFSYLLDGKTYEAEAEIIADNKVLVRFPKEAEVISYAWSDSPLDANLYSEDRLPVVPFRIEL